MISAVDLFALQLGTDAKSFPALDPFQTGSFCVTHHISWSGISRSGIATGVGVTISNRCSFHFEGDISACPR